MKKRKHLPDLLREFQEKHPEFPYFKMLDPAPYRPTFQAFRLIHNTKMGQNRPLIPLKELGSYTFAENFENFEAHCPTYIDNIDLEIRCQRKLENLGKRKRDSESILTFTNSNTPHFLAKNVEQILRNYGDSTSIMSPIPKIFDDGITLSFKCKTNGERLCPHGDTHKSNSFDLHLRSQGYVAYFCQGCQKKGAIVIGNIN